jgi:hypothetical protein
VGELVGDPDGDLDPVVGESVGIGVGSGVGPVVGEVVGATVVHTVTVPHGTIPFQLRLMVPSAPLDPAITRTKDPTVACGVLMRILRPSSEYSTTIF